MPAEAPSLRKGLNALRTTSTERRSGREEYPIGGFQRRHAAGESLLTVINDILDFSKIEAGKLQIESIVFDLGLVIEDVSEMLATKAEEKMLDPVLGICARRVAPLYRRRRRHPPGGDQPHRQRNQVHAPWPRRGNSDL